jgi:myosin-5
MAHSYDVGTKAWQPDATEGWVASEVTSKTADGDKVTLIFSLANGEVCCPNTTFQGELVLIFWCFCRLRK